MKLQGPIDALPQVAVANRHHRAESLPLPVVFAPLAQLATNAAADVAAASEQRDARRAIERFEAADDGQQFQPAAAGVRFRIGGRESLDRRRPIAGRISNAACRAGSVRFGMQQEVGQGRLHRCGCCQVCRADGANEFALPPGGPTPLRANDAGPRPMQAGRLQLA